MLPIELDQKVLNTLPRPTEKAINRVFQAMHAVLGQKTIPYFRNYRGVSLAQLASLRQKIFFMRMEDDGNKIELPTLLIHQRQSLTILVHKRLFDYMACVLPLGPELSLSGGSREEQQLVKFIEFFLRHHFEHLVFPEKTESEVVKSDVDFAVHLSRSDQEGYRMLRNALTDPLTGIIGIEYMRLFDRAEQGESCDLRIARMATLYNRDISKLPARFLLDIFPDLDTGSKLGILGRVFRTSRDPEVPLVKRAANLRRVLRLFALTSHHDAGDGLELFRMFKQRWGLKPLFYEVGLPISLIQQKGIPQLF